MFLGLRFNGLMGLKRKGRHVTEYSANKRMADPYPFAYSLAHSLTPYSHDIHITYRDLLASATAGLAANGVEDARAEAEALIMGATAWSRAWLYAHSQDIVSNESRVRAGLFIRRRALHEPTAYIIGHREFCGRDFAVDRRVLIPRPETEMLVDVAIAASRCLLAKKPSVAIADVGTGSGAVAVSVTSNVPNAVVYATEVSADALEVARSNCHQHGVQDRIRLLGGDLLGPIEGELDIIVTNLPYVKDSDFDALPPEIKEFEPSLALRGGKAGLDVIRRLLEQAVGKISDGGTIALEIAWDQGISAAHLARTLFPGARIGIRKDLAGLDRLMVIALAGAEAASR
ncbi:MAG: peptide chain release factor N(5)-glutamine methyltransferase [Chloroflexi bacterium]|nr:peptide chain release factor N(5)-glutamine methyltransferase [Chloroflexota bacterium]